jgi:hypothetical protein
LVWSGKLQFQQFNQQADIVRRESEPSGGGELLGQLRTNDPSQFLGRRLTVSAEQVQDVANQLHRSHQRAERQSPSSQQQAGEYSDQLELRGACPTANE